MTTDKADRATFQITDATAEQVDVSCLQLDWHFSFCDFIVMQPCRYCACSACDCAAQMAEVMEEQALRQEAQWLPAEDDVPFYDWAQA